jgi:hypothetical protein
VPHVTEQGWLREQTRSNVHDVKAPSAEEQERRSADCTATVKGGNNGDSKHAGEQQGHAFASQPQSGARSVRTHRCTHKRAGHDCPPAQLTAGGAERTHPDWTVAQAAGVAWFGAALSDIAQDLAAQHNTGARNSNSARPLSTEPAKKGQRAWSRKEGRHTRRKQHNQIEQESRQTAKEQPAEQAKPASKRKGRTFAVLSVALQAAKVAVAAEGNRAHRRP